MKITQLSSDTSPATTDVVPMVDVAHSITKKITLSALLAFIFGNPPAGQLPPTGSLMAYAVNIAPTGWLLCDGAAVSRTTYATLFSALNPAIGTFTVTIASPAVVTLNAHGLVTGDQVYLTTTGALPTGLSTNTLYYVVKVDANTFNLATSRANAYAGTKINTSGTQSGTHTLNLCPYGLGDGSTTFNLPDVRGRIIAGNDLMTGTAASRLTLPESQGVYGNQGANGGEQDHALITAELAAHNHGVTDPGHSHTETVASGTGGGLTGITGTANLQGNTGSTQTTNSSTTGVTTNNAGSGSSHNNVQPTLVMNYIIKT